MSCGTLPEVATIRALILNSGIGKRMGDLTRDRCKCMVEIAEGRTVFDLQLLKLADCGVTDVVVTTGPFADDLERRARDNHPGLHFTFVNNPEFDSTNYIYSIALAEKALRGDDLVMMHGDLVFETEVLRGILQADGSAVVVDTTLPLPDKDFKAVVQDGRVVAVGIEFFDDAVACQPLYRLSRADWELWLDAIVDYCERGIRGVYAEHALNELTDTMTLRPYDVHGAICTEVDTVDDLQRVRGHADVLLER
jgi:L-glutamine-phosphate cytidylyltransferase